MDFLSPWSLAGLVLVPAILLWGLLAPRGRRVVVGSLMLWRRALGSGPVGRPSVRVRLRDPMLWLDVSLILLLVVACARPSSRTQAPDQPIATLVIDRTASLLIQEGGQSRWQTVREMVRTVLSEVADAPVRVVTVPGDSGRSETVLTALNDVLPGKTFQWRPLLAAGDVWPVAIAEAAEDKDRPVIVVTDIAPNRDLPPNVYVLAPGGTQENAGLVRVASRIEDGKAWLLLRARAGAGVVDPILGHRITGSGFFDEAYDFHMPQGGGTSDVVIPLKGPLPSTLRVELISPDAVPRPPDVVFPYDDQVRIGLKPASGHTVVMTGRPDPSLRAALAVIDGVRVIEHTGEAPIGEGEADVLVACESAVPPEWSGPTVVVAPTKDVAAFEPVDGEAQGEWRVEASNPLASALYAGPARIGKVRRYKLGQGAQLLLGTPDTPLMATWQVGGVRRLAILFPLDEKTTDWPNREGFPVFWQHALKWLVPADQRPAEYAIAGLPAAEEDKGLLPAGQTGAEIIGSDEPYQSGPGRDDSAAAIDALRASAAARMRLAHMDLWPFLAALALALLLVRAWRAR